MTPVGERTQHRAAYDMIVFDQEDGGHPSTVLGAADGSSLRPTPEPAKLVRR
ncbi:hypothetical protein VAB18032_14480 [Micromonospora maris AB-18-032]|nr:hypothetical protein VAB18032_14480 [Micromonospora maris AB-18-032]